MSVTGAQITMQMSSGARITAVGGTMSVFVKAPITTSHDPGYSDDDGDDGIDVDSEGPDCNDDDDYDEEGTGVKGTTGGPPPPPAGRGRALAIKDKEEDKVPKRTFTKLIRKMGVNENADMENVKMVKKASSKKRRS